MLNNLKVWLDKNSAKIIIVIIVLVLAGYGIWNFGKGTGDWLFNQVNVSDNSSLK